MVNNSPAGPARGQHQLRETAEPRSQHSLDCLQLQFEHSPQRRQAKPSPSKGIIAMRALENKLECIYRVIYIYRALYKAEKYTEVNKRTAIYVDCAYNHGVSDERGEVEWTM